MEESELNVIKSGIKVQKIFAYLLNISLMLALLTIILLFSRSWTVVLYVGSLGCYFIHLQGKHNLKIGDDFLKYLIDNDKTKLNKTFSKSKYYIDFLVVLCSLFLFISLVLAYSMFSETFYLLILSVLELGIVISHLKFLKKIRVYVRSTHKDINN
ncbi:hypothetical protein BWK59_00860 [Flavobacterium davisii]|uniref:Uncharacterized protein n=1 Tax=Flavobacterium davisii TaxID=2906077 RepID=A0A246GLN1_9FLAO|nr:hypothetical protein [Flavobacterium davisii]OWP85317.1 hypothetical protein BWK59_00860 [Flavobacterium davisii]